MVKGSLTNQNNSQILSVYSRFMGIILYQTCEHASARINIQTGRLGSKVGGDGGGVAGGGEEVFGLWTECWSSSEWKVLGVEKTDKRSG